MKKTTKIVLTIITLLSCNFCLAANWVEYGYKTYIDLSSWSRNGNYVSAWVKRLNTGDWELVNNKKVWYSIEYIEAACSTRKLSINSAVKYDLKGNVISSDDFGSTYFHKVIPDSIGEDLYYSLCSLK